MTPKLTTPIPSPSSPIASVADEQLEEIALHAISLIGTPYHYGGNTPETGFDCSGFIKYNYQRAAGIFTPRTVAAMQNWGSAIDANQARPGDLVLFGAGIATHAGIYVGEKRFIHAPSTGGRVRLDSTHSPYWRVKHVTYRSHR